MLMPTVGYVDTMRLMIRSGSSAAYNVNTVIILFAGQGLKALYYVHHRFATVVFGQCVALLICATALTTLNFWYDPPEASALVIGQFTPDRCPFFIRWLSIRRAKSCGRFVFVLAVYALVVLCVFSALCHLVGEAPIVEGIGVIANLIEATVSLPIFVRVVVQRDIADLSVVLIFQYMLADVMKIGLFLITRVPFCFIFGACCQLTVDMVTIVTYLRLRRKTALDVELTEGS
jgi:hypothetical protein